MENILQEELFNNVSESLISETHRRRKLWRPQVIFFTKSAVEHPHGQSVLQKLRYEGHTIQELSSNRIPNLNQESIRETYRNAKQSMAFVIQPPSAFRLAPIPPSADWQYHVAEGCPGHCQYCYLAGSLSGAPIVRAFVNIPEILSNLHNYESSEKITSYEVSCYTDPLAIEHLTESLAESIVYFGTRKNAQLRWVTKYDNVEPLLHLPHNGNTQCRVSVNCNPISKKLESGTSSVDQRLEGLKKLALCKYKIGIVIAPIMNIQNWKDHYMELFELVRHILSGIEDLSFELITHRFTPKSKQTLLDWYPKTTLNMDEEEREKKTNKFGGYKFVYTKDDMSELKSFFYSELKSFFPKAKILYWT